MDLDYRWYTLTVEVDGPDGTTREIGVIRGQLPTDLTGTGRLAGLAVMLDAAARKLDAEACYPHLSVPPGVDMPRSVDHPPW